MSNPEIVRGSCTTGMAPERLAKLRATWEDGDLDYDDEEEMLEALEFFIRLTHVKY